MALNYIWAAFFVIGVAVGLGQWLFLGDTQILPAMLESTFESSKKAFEISLGLTGAMALWLGLLKLAEEGGLIRLFSRGVAPFFTKLFPGIPQDHPALGAILMNFSANMLGLDNAATPLGLKAMQHMQELNPQKDTASNDQIMFLAINTAGLTLVPVSIMALRAEAGAANPADIFLPCLLTTSLSALAAIVIVGLVQRINLLKGPVLLVLATYALGLSTLVWGIRQMSATQVEVFSQHVSALLLFGLILSFIIVGLVAKLRVYETFVEGAKEGFETAVKIIPYVVAMLVGIGVFRASGTLDAIMNGVAALCQGLGLPTDFVPALPTGLMKPFSGSGARGLMIETMKTYGADSFAGRLSSIIQGGTETTFYTLAVYYGSVSIRQTRYTAQVGLLVDFIGIAVAIGMGYLFFPR